MVNTQKKFEEGESLRGEFDFRTEDPKQIEDHQLEENSQTVF